MIDTLTELGDDAYLVITPFGAVQACFDEDSSGMRLTGHDDAIAHIKHVLPQITGSHGYALSVDCCSPDDFYRFCQPDWSGIKIDPPLAVALAFFLEKQQHSKP